MWVCVLGLGMGLFGLWYVPRLKRARARSAARRGQPRGDVTSDAERAGPGRLTRRHAAPGSGYLCSSGSKTVSSTETPGMSTRS